MDELSLPWLILTHILHYLQILDQWDQLYSRHRIDISGKPVAKAFLFSFAMLYLTRSKARKDVLKHIYGS